MILFSLIRIVWTDAGCLIALPVMETRWLSVEEIATHLGIKPDTVYKWIGRRNLPAHKVGRLWKFQAAEVDEWVRSGSASQLASDASEEAE